MPTIARVLSIAAAVLLVSGCAANPKSAKGGTDVIDGAATAAAAPAETTPAPSAADVPAESPAPAESCALVRVAFAFDSAQLDQDAMRHLRANAECLSRRGATSLLVEGHCDERGTTEYNIALGARRADAVKQYLLALGVGASIDSVSFGKEIPLATGSGDGAWAQNRRAEMRLPGDKRSDGRLVAGR